MHVALHLPDLLSTSRMQAIARKAALIQKRKVEKLVNIHFPIRTQIKIILYCRLYKNFVDFWLSGLDDGILLALFLIHNNAIF